MCNKKMLRIGAYTFTETNYGRPEKVNRLMANINCTEFMTHDQEIVELNLPVL